MIEIIASVVTLLVLMAIYLFAGKLEFSHVHYYRNWISFSAGVSIAYVFLHLLPEFSLYQSQLPQIEAPISFSAILDNRVYIMSLIGLLVYAGLERLIYFSHIKTNGSANSSELHSKLIYFHIAGYFIYNVLIGYLVVYEATLGLLAVLLFMIAMGLHFFVITHSLYESYGEYFSQKSRGLLASGIAIGWLIGSTLDVPKNIKIILFSFLAGGMIVNIIREEMPSGKNNHYWPFVVGVLGYTVLLLVAYIVKHH